MNDNKSQYSVRVFEWDVFNNNKGSPIAWTEIGRLVTGNEVLDMSASTLGDRVAVGFDGGVIVFEHEYTTIDTS